MDDDGWEKSFITDAINGLVYKNGRDVSNKMMLS
jgi:hypothetical protein